MRTKMTRLNEKWVEKSPVAVTPSAGAITLTPGLEQRFFVVTVNANITSITINAPDGCVDFNLLLQFSGSYSVSGFPAAVKWGIGSNVPSFSGTSGQEVLVVMSYWDGTVGYRADASAAYTPASES